MNRRELELAALGAADRCLKARGHIALDDVFREMGKLDAKQWEVRSAEVNATATSAIDTHGQVANESGAYLDTGFTPTSASESAPVPAMP